MNGGLRWLVGSTGHCETLLGPALHPSDEVRLKACSLIRYAEAIARTVLLRLGEISSKIVNTCTGKELRDGIDIAIFDDPDHFGFRIRTGR